MATTIGVTAAADFIPEIVANRALEVLRNQIVVARLVARDSEYVSARVGQKISVPFVGAVTANPKAAGSAVTLQAPSNSAVEITLDKHYETSFLIEDAAQAMANQELIDRLVEAAVPALAEQIEESIIEAMGDATNSVGTYGTDLSYATVLSANKKLTDGKAPRSGRALLISTKDAVALKSDEDLQAYFAYGQAQLAEGSIGRLDGFDVYESQLVPAVAGTPVQTRNFAFQRNGVILAMRALPEVPAGMGARTATIRDSESGLMVRAVYAYSPTYLGMQLTLDALWGVAIARQGLVVEVKA